MIRLVLFTTILFSPLAYASDTDVVDTALEMRAENYPGHELRPILSIAGQLMTQGRDDDAWAGVNHVLDVCERVAGMPGGKMVTVMDADEERSYRAAHPGKDLYFADIACATAHQSAAFLAVRNDDPPRALAHLNSAQAVAPYWAAPLAERAHLISQLGDHRTALATYRKAQELAERFPASAYLKPLVLRGIGFTLIELGDLAGAQRAYEQSLKLEPRNPIADGQLLYIAQLRLAKNPDMPPQTLDSAD